MKRVDPDWMMLALAIVIVFYVLSMGTRLDCWHGVPNACTVYDPPKKEVPK